MRALMWFRSDLRVADNPALTAACRHAPAGVVAVFICTPSTWKTHDWGERRVAWTLSHVAALRASLAPLQIPLHIVTVDTFQDVPRCLVRLADELGCDALYYNRQYELDESRRDTAVAQRLRERGRAVHSYDDQVLIPPEHLRSQGGGFYTVYTPFKRAWLQTLHARGGAEPLPEPPAQSGALEVARQALLTPAEFAASSRPFPSAWTIGESAALQRLADFTARCIDTYGEQRDLPASDGTSGLSPYLAVGAVSARQCLAAAVHANGHQLPPLVKPATQANGATTWIQELIWREFYRHVMVGFPRVCMHKAFREGTDALPWRGDGPEFQAWCAGRTGVPIVDAAMRQLQQTGWMHNRLRMISAMYLSKNLFVDWRLGERYFSQQLIDLDLASNNGGWQWCASTGTDAAPYFRLFNPYRQSAKFDPQARFMRRYLPELEDVPSASFHDPAALAALDFMSCGYPRPSIGQDASRRRVLAAFGSLSKG